MLGDNNNSTEASMAARSIMNNGSNHQQPFPQQQAERQEPRASPTAEEFYDPLPYQRPNLVPQQQPQRQSQQPSAFYAHNEQQQLLQYDQQFQGTRYPGVADQQEQQQQAQWQSQPKGAMMEKRGSTTVNDKNNINGVIEPVPIWPNAVTATTNRNNSNTSESRRPSQQHPPEDDSNPIPIQPRYHHLYHQQPIVGKGKRSKHYEIGQSSSGLHIPKQQQQQWGRFPIPTADAARPLGEADSFQGRPFYPPQHQQAIPLPQQQHRNTNFFHLADAQQFHLQPPQPVARSVEKAPPRGTTPIPTSFAQNQFVSKKQHTLKPVKEKKSSPKEKSKTTRKRPWHRRTVPGDASNDNEGLASKSSSYVAKVHQMLEDAPTQGFEHIVSWQPHGRAFKIHKPAEFAQEILPKYFSTKKIAHFSRWLSAWGFVKHREGADRDAFYHRYFVRGVVVYLVSGLSRNEMFESMKGWLGPGEDPDLCSGKECKKKPREKSDEDDEEDEEDQQKNSSELLDSQQQHHKNPRRLRGTLLETIRQMLDEASPKRFDHIVSWLPGGRAFKVHDTVAFQETVCGNYFQTNLLRSFSDSLRTWGFCRLWEANGMEKNAYYHRLFQQGKPHLCRHYSRAQMLNAMKDFREEQKRQKEISWSLFPRHRQGHHQETTTAHHHKLSLSASMNELAAKAGQVGEDAVVLAGRQDDDLSDAGGDIDGGEACPLAIDAPNQIPQPQDYLIPYLDLPNANPGTTTDKNRNNTSNNVEMDNSMRPSFGENYGMDTCYHILQPGTMGNTVTTFPSKTNGDDKPKPLTAIQETTPAIPQKYNLKRLHDSIARNDRETGLSYVIRISMMLEMVERDENQHIVSWRSHGRAFKIHDEKAFESKILPRYFSATSVASFHRWLNKWGFLRFRAGKDRRCWYHRLFVRGVVDLLKGFTQREMFAAMEEWRAPGKEPDFYCSGKGHELSELPLVKNPNKKQKIGIENTTGSIENHDTNDNETISEKPSSGDKEFLTTSSPLLQPQTDPKSLRGTLVEKLREMLEVVQKEGNAHVVSWLPHGKAFKIHNQKVFRENIMHRFFGVSKYRYFGDVLRSWGFVIFKNGRDKGAFYHKCFLRDQPKLCLHLARTQLKASMKDWPKRGAAPDFYRDDDSRRDNDSCSFPVQKDLRLAGTSSIQQQNFAIL